MMTGAEVRRLFEKLRAGNPSPETELHYESPFEMLVAVMLSAQATDVSVNRATGKLFAEANSPEAFLHLGENGLKRYISSIGLYNSKAKNIIRTCEILVNVHGGKVPGDRKALESLPGVGRKTANVILNVLFGKPVIAVDTHIFRVANRTGLARGKTPLAVEKKLMHVTPKPFLHHAHHWLVLHGRYVCTARNPRCISCPIYQECKWQEKGKSASL
jgi:endonuclease-3